MELSDRLKKSQQLVRDKYDPNFSWVINEEIKWPDFKKKLNDCTIALLTSCGIYQVDTQLPFDAWNNFGDSSFREIHIDTPRDRLKAAHSHYDHKYVIADINTALPIDHLYALEQEGFINRFYPWIYSFMGYNPQPKQLLEETITKIAKRFKDEKIDGVLLTPC